MKRFILLPLLLSLLSPLGARADGIVVPSTAYPATVTIPDQRALICFSNGTERLVIETRFTGAGTNFAWVVPFPSKPVIEQATTGLFPTLQYLFRPQIVTRVPQYFPWICALMWIYYAFLFVRPTGRVTGLDIASCGLVAVSIASVRAAPGLSNDGWIVLGIFVFLCLFSVLALVRHWHKDMRGLAVALLVLFIVVQLLAALFYITFDGVQSLLSEPVFLFFSVLDYILILLLATWKQAGHVVCAVVLVFLIPFLFIPFLPVLATAKSRSASMGAVSMPRPSVSILQRKMVGIFETTTIASSDASALQDWLAENGYTVPANAGPVIADYVKGGWVFVASKICRDEAAPDTLTPHPLSFTFTTDKPVYPMRLTGLANKSLSVDLYVFSSDTRASAPHFKTESCTQPAIGHPLLAKWTAGLPVATKLSATLTASDMRQDVWVNQSRYVAKEPNRLYSGQAAWIMALNHGAVFFAIGLVSVCLVGFLNTRHKDKVPVLARAVVIASVLVIGLSWLCVPRADLKWIRGGAGLWREQGLGIEIFLGDNSYTNLAQSRAEMQAIRHSNEWVKSWDNAFTGEPVREEDSPGNYILQATNNELQLLEFGADGRPDVTDIGSLQPVYDSSKK